MSVASLVAERIRRPMPRGLSVLAGSLPVVSFGDPQNAKVATLSLNPSWFEFQSRSGAWLLREGKRRLASLVSLGADDPRKLDDHQVAQVVAESNAYFHRNPYWTWFQRLESLLREARAEGSYLDGSACHLDLVQWATKPAQRDLPREVWKSLVEQDQGFLQWQLGNSNVKKVLLNGASVVCWVKQVGLVRGLDEDVVRYEAANGEGKICVFHAVTTEGVRFVGWNKPLARLAADGRQKLNRWVHQVLHGHGSEAADEGKPLLRGRATSAAVGLVGGFVPVDTVVEGAPELERVLSHWFETSNEPTVGDVGTFEGSPVIIVRMGTDEFVLNRDTKRAAVQAFLAAAKKAGGAGNLIWHVTANSRGTINRVSYRPDEEATPGWYAYLKEPSSEPRKLE